MILSTDYIDAYIKQENLPEEAQKIYEFTKGKRVIENNRQEVCIALCEMLKGYEKQFPLWNDEVISTLFKDDLSYINQMIVLPIVGAQADFDCEVIENQDRIYILVDLLNIANYTVVVKEMEYILHNQIHQKVLRYVLHQRYEKPTSYAEQLVHRCFVQGLSQFLAWRNGLDGVFTQTQYEEKRQRSKMLFKKAIHIEDASTQQQILQMLKVCDLWDDFATCFGMFTFASIYQEKKAEGLYEQCMLSPNAFL